MEKAFFSSWPRPSAVTSFPIANVSLELVTAHTKCHASDGNSAKLDLGSSPIGLSRFWHNPSGIS